MPRTKKTRTAQGSSVSQGDFHPVMDPPETLNPQQLSPLPSQISASPSSQPLPRQQFAEISTTSDHAHDPHPVAIVTSANTVTALTCTVSVPICRDNPLTSIERGPCTPIQPLILECEICNHPDKAFVVQLL